MFYDNGNFDIRGLFFSPYKQKTKLFSISVTSIFVIGVTIINESAIFLPSHEIVFLLAISGVGLAYRILKDNLYTGRIRKIAFVFFLSLFAGLITSLTAYKGLFNFPIGGLFAACSAIFMLNFDFNKNSTEADDQLKGINTFQDRVMPLILPLISCIAMAIISSNFYYGQFTKITYSDSVLVEGGVFKGLKTDVDTKNYIIQLSEALKSISRCGNKVSVFGIPSPGLYLLTSMLPRNITSWDIPTNKIKNFATDTQRYYFSLPKNEPDVIVLSTTSMQSVPSSPFEQEFIESYVLDQQISVGRYSAKIYRKTSCVRTR